MEKTIKQVVSEIIPQPDATTPAMSISQKVISDAKSRAKEYWEYFKIMAERRQPGYAIDADNEKVIKKLCAYWAGIDTEGLNTDKGIYLFGAIGCGKTLIMEIFSSILKDSFHRFQVVSTRDVVRKFAEEGHKGIKAFGKNSYRTNEFNGADVNNPITRCFDDFGLEDSSAKFYGNNANAMSEVMLDRYDGYRHHGMITHVTSNLPNGELIEKIYGDRVRSRMREMLNFIELPGKDRRK